MTESNAVLASVWSIPVKVIKTLPLSYKIPDPLPWAKLAGPLAAAEDTVARVGQKPTPRRLDQTNALRRRLRQFVA